MSPSGIQADSPLQRTWMILFANGRSGSKAARVSGASGSQTAPNSNRPAVMRMSVMRLLSTG